MVLHLTSVLSHLPPCSLYPTTPLQLTVWCSTSRHHTAFSLLYHTLIVMDVSDSPPATRACACAAWYSATAGLACERQQRSDAIRAQATLSAAGAGCAQPRPQHLRAARCVRGLRGERASNAQPLIMEVQRVVVPPRPNNLIACCAFVAAAARVPCSFNQIALQCCCVPWYSTPAEQCPSCLTVLELMSSER